MNTAGGFWFHAEKVFIAPSPAKAKPFSATPKKIFVMKKEYFV